MHAPLNDDAPLWVLTAEEMQRWDRAATEGAGIPERVLMEVAGRAAARVVHEEYPRGRVVAAVGRGHNGGDAVVALRALRAWGREVAAVAVGGAEPEAALLHGWEIPIVDESAYRDAGVIVDGILGTGARGAPREVAAAAVEAVNAAGRPVVALDGPTGVDMTTGGAPGAAVRAALTVTFGAPKRGLLLFPGREHAGRIVAVEVGFPPLPPALRTAALVTPAWAGARTPRRAADAYKGAVGTLGVLAGRPGMGGAAILVVHGALRYGTGRVRVVSHEANRLALQTAMPEAMFTERGGEAMEEALRATDALVAGPGMGTDDETVGIIRRALAAAPGPAVIDADAITLLARNPDLLDGYDRGRFLLTPHPGEMSRLLGVETDEVLADPFAAAARAVERYGCAVLLKGSPSLVAAPGEPTLISVAGHSGIATGGQGDTLAGIAGALLGAGASPRDAAALALFYAGRAAERVGFDRPVLPRDVAEALPAVLAEADEADVPTARAGVLLDLPRAR